MTLSGRKRNRRSVGSRSKLKCPAASGLPTLCRRLSIPTSLPRSVPAPIPSRSSWTPNGKFPAMVNQATLIYSRCTHIISNSVRDEAISSIRESAQRRTFEGDLPRAKRFLYLLTTTVAWFSLNCSKVINCDAISEKTLKRCSPIPTELYVAD